MKFLCLMDFDDTLNTNKDIDLETKNILNSYLENNKLCIISESSFNELEKFINKLNIKCDLYSTSDMKYMINNKLYDSSFKKDILFEIINKFDDYIYTLYLKSNNQYYVYKYQERLELLYPKGYKELQNISFDINFIVGAFNIKNKNEIINYIINNNLYYDILGEDKNRILLRIKKDNFNKNYAYNILTNNYKNYKTIGITDSYFDYDMIKNCDIKVSMINGDNKLKINSDYITEYDNNGFGAIKILKKICHLS